MESLNLPTSRFTASMMEEFAGWFVKLPAWMHERYASEPGDLYVVNPVRALEILYAEEQVNNLGFHLIVTEDFPLIIQHTGGSWADFARLIYGFQPHIVFSRADVKEPYAINRQFLEIFKGLS